MFVRVVFVAVSFPLPETRIIVHAHSSPDQPPPPLPPPTTAHIHTIQRCNGVRKCVRWRTQSPKQNGRTNLCRRRVCVLCALSPRMCTVNVQRTRVYIQYDRLRALIDKMRSLAIADNERVRSHSHTHTRVQTHNLPCMRGYDQHTYARTRASAPKK